MGSVFERIRPGSEEVVGAVESDEVDASDWVLAVIFQQFLPQKPFQSSYLLLPWHGLREGRRERRWGGGLFQVVV